VALYFLQHILLFDVKDYNDEVTQSQVQELRYLNGEASSPVARGGRGRNPAPIGGDFPGPRGLGAMLRYVQCIRYA